MSLKRYKEYIYRLYTNGKRTNQTKIMTEEAARVMNETLKNSEWKKEK